MEKIEYWRADDGTEFDTEKECYEYEHKYDELSKKVTLLRDFDHPLRRTGNFATDFEIAQVMIIPDDETAEQILDFATEHGVENPFDRFNGLPVTAGTYYYDDSWHCLEYDIFIAQEKLDRAHCAASKI